MVSSEQLAELAEAFALFGRGCKKIRKVLLSLSEKPEVVPEQPETATESDSTDVGQTIESDNFSQNALSNCSNSFLLPKAIRAKFCIYSKNPLTIPPPTVP